MLFSRHLDEADDLRAYGRDAPLVDSPENRKKLEDISDTLYEKIVQGNKEAAMFVTSPRIRAIQTAELVADDIGEKSDHKIKIRYSVNKDLRATDQGDFILPEDYKPDAVFTGLKVASKVFDRETHGSDLPDMADNIDYRFGDPVLLQNGEYKYPELVGYFSDYGESYRDSLIRLFSVIIDSSKKYESFLGSTEVVVVAHGQIYHVFRGLIELSKMIKGDHIEFKTGDSIKMLWEIYKNCSDDQKVTGICLPLDFECLGDEKIMALLQDEINFLRDNSQEST